MPSPKPSLRTPADEGDQSQRRDAARPRDPARSRRAHQQLILILSVAVLGAAALLRVEGGQRVVVPGVEVALPEVCTSQRLLGISCPGCGLTRSFISLADGDLGRAWQYNPAGVLLFGFVVAQIPFRSFQIGRLATGREPVRLEPLATWILIAIAGGLFAQWIVRQFTQGEIT